MKKLFFILFIIISSTSIFSQSKDTAKPKINIRQYWFVMLVKGDNRNQDSATAAKIQAGHMSNMSVMHKAGKLKVAGPFGDDGDWRGIFIFDCATKEEVEKLLQTDPAITSGRLKAIIKPWFTESSGSFKPGIPILSN